MPVSPLRDHVRTSASRSDARKHSQAPCLPASIRGTTNGGDQTEAVVLGLRVHLTISRRSNRGPDQLLSETSGQGGIRTHNHLLAKQPFCQLELLARDLNSIVGVEGKTTRAWRLPCSLPVLHTSPIPLCVPGSASQCSYLVGRSTCAPSTGRRSSGLVPWC